jgi:hypothetical protein
MIGAIFGAILAFLTRPRVCRIDWEGEPLKTCPDCHGLGVVHPGDEYFECDCPCRMRFL